MSARFFSACCPKISLAEWREQADPVWRSWSGEQAERRKNREKAEKRAREGREWGRDWGREGRELGEGVADHDL